MMMSISIMNAVYSNWFSSWTGSENLYNDVLVIVLIVFLLIVLAAALTILKAIRSIVRITMPEVIQQEREAKILAKSRRVESKTKRIQWWNKLMGLRPISEEKDIVIDHEYDGIRELDNPVPLWFNGLFYASVVFGIVYLFVYHVFGWGLNQDQEYEHEMARAELAKQEYLAQAANLVDENNVEIDLSVETINAGKATYTASCAVCHGALGEGGIGPNLTDDYWLHGGKIEDVFKVVKYGVLDKGMVPWEQSLSPAQIAEVSNYILSLRGSNPPNPKEPQGAKVEHSETDESEKTEDKEPVVLQEAV